MLTHSEHQIAYVAGYRAQSGASNPYVAKSVQWYAWRSGWADWAMGRKSQYPVEMRTTEYII
jgi:hypothetical protein